MIFHFGIFILHVGLCKGGGGGPDPLVDTRHLWSSAVDWVVTSASAVASPAESEIFYQYQAVVITLNIVVSASN